MAQNHKNSGDRIDQWIEELNKDTELQFKLQEEAEYEDDFSFDKSNDSSFDEESEPEGEPEVKPKFRRLKINDAKFSYDYAEWRNNLIEAIQCDIGEHKYSSAFLKLGVGLAHEKTTADSKRRLLLNLLVPWFEQSKEVDRYPIVSTRIPMSVADVNHIYDTAGSLFLDACDRVRVLMAIRVEMKAGEYRSGPVYDTAHVTRLINSELRWFPLRTYREAKFFLKAVFYCHSYGDRFFPEVYDEDMAYRLKPYLIKFVLDRYKKDEVVLNCGELIKKCTLSDGERLAILEEIILPTLAEKYGLMHDMCVLMDDIRVWSTLITNSRQRMVPILDIFQRVASTGRLCTTRNIVDKIAELLYRLKFWEGELTWGILLLILESKCWEESRSHYPRMVLDEMKKLHNPQDLQPSTILQVHPLSFSWMKGIAKCDFTIKTRGSALRYHKTVAITCSGLVRKKNSNVLDLSNRDENLVKWIFEGFYEGKLDFRKIISQKPEDMFGTDAACRKLNSVLDLVHHLEIVGFSQEALEPVLLRLYETRSWSWMQYALEECKKMRSVRLLFAILKIQLADPYGYHHKNL